MKIFADLRRRQQCAEPIQIAVVGTGFIGAGLVRQIARMDGLVPAIVANRTLDRAIASLQAAGVGAAQIRRCEDVREASVALDAGCHVVTADLTLPARLPQVDVVLEATGNVSAGVQVAIEAIQNGKHIVAVNAETQATVGPILKRMADAAGVVYSGVDGDQPGILKNLHDYCVGLGFTPVAAGNCKGVLKRYATPETQAAFAQANGLGIWLATSAADGTNINMEMATVADATGMAPAVRGMAGPETTLETVVADFERLGLLDGEPIVEYTLGIPKGVFVIVRSDDPAVRRDLRYLRMGEGPHYLFYRPHVLVHYEAPLSAAEAVLYHTATIAPLGAPIADVATFAKQDLAAGTTLDGIGGAHCYGLITRAAEARAERLLPVGLAGYARLTRAIPRDHAITYDDIEFEPAHPVVALRRRQDALFPM